MALTSSPQMHCLRWNRVGRKGPSCELKRECSGVRSRCCAFHHCLHCATVFSTPHRALVCRLALCRNVKCFPHACGSTRIGHVQRNPLAVAVIAKLLSLQFTLSSALCQCFAIDGAYMKGLKFTLDYLLYTGVHTTRAQDTTQRMPCIINTT